MKKVFISITIGIFAFSLSTLPVQADNVAELLKSALNNYNAKKYSKAMEDLDWARKEIASKQLDVLKKLLPASLPGYQTSPDVDGGSVLGIDSVSRDYTNGDKRIKITISGGQPGNAGSGLGALMGMAAAFGAMDANTKSEMVVVKGRRGQFNLESNRNGTLIFNLNNKVYVSIETTGFDSSDAAKKAAEALDFDAIEAAYN